MPMLCNDEKKSDLSKPDQGEDNRLKWSVWSAARRSRKRHWQAFRKKSRNNNGLVI